LALGRWCENVKCIRRIAHYTLKHEGQILGRKGGWESYLYRKNKGRVPVLLSAHSVVFWLVLIFCTMTIATYELCLYQTWRHPFAFAIVIGAFATMMALVMMGQPVRRLVSQLWQGRSDQHRGREGLLKGAPMRRNQQRRLRYSMCQTAAVVMQAFRPGSIGSATISTGCPHWCRAVFIINPKLEIGHVGHDANGAPFVVGRLHV